MRRFIASVAIGVLMLLFAAPALAHEDHVTSTYSPVPTDAAPIGETSPVVAALAAGGIILVGAAGIYIYRLIKKGL